MQYLFAIPTFYLYYGLVKLVQQLSFYSSGDLLLFSIMKRFSYVFETNCIATALLLHQEKVTLEYLFPFIPSGPHHGMFKLVGFFLFSGTVVLFSMYSYDIGSNCMANALLLLYLKKGYLTVSFPLYPFRTTLSSF